MIVSVSGFGWNILLLLFETMKDVIKNLLDKMNYQNSGGNGFEYHLLYSGLGLDIWIEI